MKLIVALANLAVVSLTLFVPAVQAQHVKGNEAVKVTATGTKVETPPLPTTGPIRSTKPCLAGGN